MYFISIVFYFCSVLFLYCLPLGVFKHAYQIAVASWHFNCFDAFLTDLKLNAFLLACL